MKKTTLKTKDLVHIGIYTALYFLAIGLARLFSITVLPLIGTVISPGVAAVVAAPIYFLLIQKVPKFGAISLLGTIIGLFFMISGHFALAGAPYIVCSILADLLLYRSGKANTKIKAFGAYLLFTIGSTGPVIFLWLLKQSYINALVSRGKDAAYIEKVFAPITATSFYVFLIVTIIGSMIGTIFGQKIIAKHFTRKTLTS